jgi:hypothetical protein
MWSGTGQRSPVRRSALVSCLDDCGYVAVVDVAGLVESAAEGGEAGNDVLAWPETLPCSIWATFGDAHALGDLFLSQAASLADFSERVPDHLR